MRDGHFKADATIINQGTRVTGSGDGLLVLKGTAGLKLHIQVAAGLVTVGLDLIAVGGKEYERVGNGAWSVTTDTATPGSSAKGTPTYQGESQIGSDKAWHVRSKQSGTSYDEWVRESDGYLVKYEIQSDTGTFTMNFDQFNLGDDVTPPSAKEIAASQYLALVGPINTQLDSLNSRLTADVNAQDLAAFKSDIGQAASAGQQFRDGLANITFPSDMQNDVQALIQAEQQLDALELREAQASSWADIAAIDPDLTKAADAETAAANKVRGDLGLPSIS